VLADLFETCGDQIFAYCWCLLRNREMAEMALRDALAAARAHIMRLENPESAISWLYWFARAQCRRRWPVLPDVPGLREEPAGPDGRARLIAWNTVLSLDAAELEALDLAFRHDVKPELVLGVPPEQVQVLVDRARLALERTLSAEIVISRGMPDCPDRAKVMAGWAGTVTPELRECALRHAADCPVCGPTRPANVSPARVLAMLPWPALSPSARQEMHRVLREHRPLRRRRLPWVLARP
jgi:DNA-directed RNA polymerase specialized sigma24 family protein